MKESQVCADYRRSNSVYTAAQLNGIPAYMAAEILLRNGYPVTVKPEPQRQRAPRKPNQKETRKQIAQENKIKRAAERVEQNAKIKELAEQGLSNPEIGRRVNLSSSAVFYRKMEIYEPGKYREHLKKCAEYEKSKKPQSECESLSGKGKYTLSI